MVPEKSDHCDTWNQKKVMTRVSDASRLSVGGMLTEFGACAESNNTSGDADQCLNEITRTLDAADQQFQSWAYWQYKYFSDITTQSGVDEGLYHSDGSLQAKKLKSLARPYARAVAGTPLFMQFNTKNAALTLQYRPSSMLPNQTSELYLSTNMWYPQGFTVEVMPADSLVWHVSGSNLLVVNHLDSLRDTDIVYISVHP